MDLYAIFFIALHKMTFTLFFFVTGINIQLEDVDERLDSAEDGMDQIDDKITALEVANVDITDRLITVEEILLGKLSSA